MDQFYERYLSSIKSKLKSSFKNFFIFFSLYSLICDGTIKVSLFTYICFLISSFYIISPIDLIPDFIPFFGFLDDITVLGLLWKGFLGLFQLAKIIIEAREKFNSNKRIFEEPECIICFSKKPDIIFKCGHKICCSDCNRKGKFTKCFLCRK